MPPGLTRGQEEQGKCRSADSGRRHEGKETTIAMAFARANRRHAEHHAVERLGWLRAAVLGANDGILSTASLIVGVAAAAGTHTSILVAGVSGLVAGAMSKAAGEYVSGSSQA